MKLLTLVYALLASSSAFAADVYLTPNSPAVNINGSVVQCLPSPNVDDLTGIDADVIVGMAVAFKLGNCFAAINSDKSVAIYLRSGPGAFGTPVQTESTNHYAAEALRNYVKAGACK